MEIVLLVPDRILEVVILVLGFLIHLEELVAQLNLVAFGLAEQVQDNDSLVLFAE